MRLRLPLTALLACLIPACANVETSVPTGKPLVATAIFAYYDAARAIGGDKIQAYLFIHPNESPHEYDITPDDKLLMSRAALFIENGLGLDDRFEKLTTDSKARILNISKAVPTAEILKTAETPLNNTLANPQESAQGNPHIWLDPEIQIQAAEKIRDALDQIAPADKATFDANAEKYIQSIRDLDKAFKQAVPTFKTREFIGFHSAYAYLAHRYGLQQIASIEEVPGEGLNVSQLAKIIKLIKEKNIHYIAKESAFSERDAQRIVDETGVKLITLQPLETYDRPGDTYVSLMTENLDALKKALQ